MKRILYAYNADSTANDSHKSTIFHFFGDAALCICGGRRGVPNEVRGRISEPISRSGNWGG